METPHLVRLELLRAAWSSPFWSCPTVCLSRDVPVSHSAAEATDLDMLGGWVGSGMRHRVCSQAHWVVFPPLTAHFPDCLNPAGAGSTVTEGKEGGQRAGSGYGEWVCPEVGLAARSLVSSGG